ncbi:MAG: glycosyltransferase family 2 protein [Crocinitomicaceae bacterium]|nr:glycosyltransferase family 2 protein [Crocinitomicaceae bacterium]
MQPLVSFIIPFFNAGKTIKETIESIDRQSYKNYDIWIINDGSTDPYSLEVLEELKDHSKITILHQENAGPSIARNKAIKETNAEVIVPLDADDRISVNTLESAIPILLAEQSTGIVYGNLIFFGENDGIKHQPQFNIQQQLIWNQIAVCCVIKKEVFKSTGYFDEFLSKLGLEDWEFWISVHLSGWRFKKIEAIHFEIRVHENSRTFQVANKNKDSIKAYVYRKHADLLATAYVQLFYDRKMLIETPDYRIGNMLLWPYRKLKSLFK